jgi:hypothetical protein
MNSAEFLFVKILHIESRNEYICEPFPPLRILFGFMGIILLNLSSQNLEVGGSKRLHLNVAILSHSYTSDSKRVAQVWQIIPFDTSHPRWCFHVKCTEHINAASLGTDNEYIQLLKKASKVYSCTQL